MYARAPQGVRFSESEPRSGGAVLNQCGGFSVVGHSIPNFLALNTLGSYIVGGNAKGPETPVFGSPVSYVQANVGHEEAGTITLACFNGMSPIGSASLAGSSALSTISISGPRINRCALSFTGETLFGRLRSPPSIMSCALGGWLRGDIVCGHSGLVPVSNRIRDGNS